MKKNLKWFIALAILTQSACQKLPTLGENFYGANYNSETLTWLFADGNGPEGINKEATRDTFVPRLISFNGKIYAGWVEPNGTANQVRVKVSTGSATAPNWQFVDGGGATGLNRNTNYAANVVYFASFSGKLYLAWQESNASDKSQIRVSVYNGDDANPVWTAVEGTQINCDITKDAEAPILLNNNNVLTLLWHEKTGGASLDQIHAKTYNGNDAAPSWSSIDQVSCPTGINVAPAYVASNPQGTVLGGKIYATWHELNANVKSMIRVRSYDGTSWQTVDNVGLNRDATKNAFFPIPIVFNGRLYVGWHEFANNISQVRIAVLSGTSTWSFVDGGGITGLNKDTTKDAVRFAPIVYNNKLYIAFTEANQSLISHVRVAVYNGNDAAPAWSFTDGNGADGLNKDKTREAIRPFAVVHNGELQIAWAEDSAAVKKQIRVISGK